uniref:hypothetical protein n=1 Tax=Enterobacter hormaechei TaxID=158836 RepID=UPI00195487E7
ASNSDVQGKTSFRTACWHAYRATHFSARELGMESGITVEMSSWPLAMLTLLIISATIANKIARYAC